MAKEHLSNEEVLSYTYQLITAQLTLMNSSSPNSPNSSILTEQNYMAQSSLHRNAYSSPSTLLPLHPPKALTILSGTLTRKTLFQSSSEQRIANRSRKWAAAERSRKRSSFRLLCSPMRWMASTYGMRSFARLECRLWRGGIGVRERRIRQRKKKLVMARGRVEGGGRTKSRCSH